MTLDRFTELLAPVSTSIGDVTAAGRPVPRCTGAAACRARPPPSLFPVSHQRRADILTTAGEGRRRSALRLVNCVEFVSWSGTFSYVTMFGHVESAAVAS